jgi:hypothetical protein
MAQRYHKSLNRHSSIWNFSGMKTQFAIAAMLLISPTLADDNQDDAALGEVVTCCYMDECSKLKDYIWRRTEYGIKVMVYETHWCPVLIRYNTRIFNGVPVDACDLLECYPTELFRH